MCRAQCNSPHQECAQGKRQTGGLREHGGAQHHQQRGGGEHIAVLQGADAAVQGAHHQPAPGNDAADAQHRLNPGQPAAAQRLQSSEQGCTALTAHWLKDPPLRSSAIKGSSMQHESEHNRPMRLLAVRVDLESLVAQSHN